MFGDEDLIILLMMEENVIEKGKEFLLWVALATCAVMYSVSYGFVRWNLYMFVLLFWYEFGLVIVFGILMVMLFIFVIGYFVVKYELNMLILARSSFGIWGAEFIDVCCAMFGFLFYVV